MTEFVIKTDIAGIGWMTCGNGAGDYVFKHRRDAADYIAAHWPGFSPTWKARCLRIEKRA